MTERETDQLGQRLKTISADVKLYVEKRIELIMLNLGERASEWAAESIQKLIGIALLAVGALFTLTTLAIYLGDLLDNLTLGFLIVSALLLMVGGLFYYLKPHSFSDYLQHQFETEVLKSLPFNGEKRMRSEQLPETSGQARVNETRQINK